MADYFKTTDEPMSFSEEVIRDCGLTLTKEERKKHEIFETVFPEDFK